MAGRCRWISPAASRSSKITRPPSTSPARSPRSNVADALHYWPLQLGEGAREWIEGNVSTGIIGPVQIETHIPAGALELPALPEDSVHVALSLKGATINYIRGVTPITDAQATGIVSGDTFTGDLTSGKVGAMSVSAGHIVVHDLHANTAVGDISAHVDGSVPDMLALIDMKPMQYPTRFHVKTEGAKGTASVDLDFRVPMLKALKVSDLGISVKGAMHDLTLALGDHIKLTNGAIDFAVDNAKLHANGDVNLDGAKLSIDWTEAFESKTAGHHHDHGQGHARR